MIKPSARRGFALLLAILGVVVAGALIVATHVAVRLEHRMATAAMARQRAFAASEHGLWASLTGWDEASAPQPGTATVKIIRAGGDSAILTIFRLNDDLYWAVADASVGEARRRTATNVLALTDSTGTHVRQVTRSWVELH